MAITKILLPLEILALNAVPQKRAILDITVTSNISASWEIAQGSVSVGSSGGLYATAAQKATFMAQLVNAEPQFNFTAYTIGAVLRLVSKLDGLLGNATGIAWNGANLSVPTDSFTNGRCIEASFLGQLALVDHTGNLETTWQWGGRVWLPTGPVILDESNGLYAILGRSLAGAPTSTTLPNQ